MKDNGKTAGERACVTGCPNRRRSWIAAAVLAALTAGVVGGCKEMEAAAAVRAADGGNAATAGLMQSGRPEKTEPSSEEKMYGIGSTSKMVVTAAVLKLAEEGKIDIDRPLVDYLPEFYMKDRRYLEITPRMLLNHSSGLQGSSLKNSMLLGDPDTCNHDMLLTWLRDQRLKADPGTLAAYCNDGFTLAEILVERVSGLGYTDYIETYFAEPLGLEHMKTPQNRVEESRLANIYDETSGLILPPENPNVIGSGGVYASAGDLCRFSQVFMRDQGEAEGILSPAMAAESEASPYWESLGAVNEDTNLSYGLGWDSVGAFPFNRLGIRALTKGGDTSFYHAGLTVLPEENISCAVLSSGGSSTLNQLAAQEIILAYLEETGQIDRRGLENELAETAEGPELAQSQPQLQSQPQQSQPQGDAYIPQEWELYSGWYAGRGMISVEMGENGKLTLKSTDGRRVTRQAYQYGGDGRFYAQEGAYISMSGELSRGSNGRIGRTFLEFKSGPEGGCYLMGGTREVWPGLGENAAYLPIGQKITEHPLADDVRQAWGTRSGKEYYLVSDKYSSASYMTNFMATPRALEEPEGYLVFDDAKWTAAEMVDENHARFFQQIPGQMGRDLNDYKIIRKNGAEYLDSGNIRLICEDSINSLDGSAASVTIQEEGETIWYSISQGASEKDMTISCPENGAFYIYDRSSKNMKCILNSYVTEPGQKLRLPKDGCIAFAGEAGAEFTISP